MTIVQIICILNNTNFYKFKSLPAYICLNVTKICYLFEYVHSRKIMLQYIRNNAKIKPWAFPLSDMSVVGKTKAKILSPTFPVSSMYYCILLMAVFSSIPSKVRIWYTSWEIFFKKHKEKMGKCVSLMRNDHPAIWADRVTLQQVQSSLRTDYQSQITNTRYMLIMREIEAMHN
jgi:hypothetical protein